MMFELQSVVVLRSKDEPRSHSSFDSSRYIRYGNGFKSWWKQERKDYIATKCATDIVSDLPVDDSYDSESNHFLQCISIYVKHQDVEVDKWRNKIFKAMGGNIHVQCSCNKMPLIPSNCSAEKKDKYNICHRKIFCFQ